MADRKRKRPSTPSTAGDLDPSDPSHPNNEFINPHAHSPSTLKQFTTAGLAHYEPLPSKQYPGFPHAPATRPRPHAPAPTASTTDHGPLNYTTGSEGDDEANAGDSTTDANPYTTGEDTDSGHTSSLPRKSKSKKGSKEKARNYDSRVGVLVNTIQRCLAEGDIPNAKWAFALLNRMEVRGKKVDLRFEGLWQLGAEVLMREGEPTPGKKQKEEEGVAAKTEMEIAEEEEEGKQEEEGEEDKDVRLARQQENLGRVKSYFECLIQQYPYDKHHPKSTGVVVELYAALFNLETKGVRAVHKRRLERVKEKEENPDLDDDDQDDAEMEMEDQGDEDVEMLDEDGDEEERAMFKRDKNVPEHLSGLTRREIRLREEKNNARLAALEKMGEIAKRMDTVMETVPFNKDQELLRLRAMVSLYLGDLYVPPRPRSEKEEGESKKAKAKQRAKAKAFLGKIKEGGGELDEPDEALWKSLIDADEDGFSSDDDEEEHTILPMFSSMGS